MESLFIVFGDVLETGTGDGQYKELINNIHFAPYIAISAVSFSCALDVGHPTSRLQSKLSLEISDVWRRKGYRQSVLETFLKLT
ncbi:hypothetical protein KC953_03720 [Candidatus Saccharibacteria bacterium]|nr:hypothetical protein [Candidatus Saccharibacteria bacterium]